MAGKLRTRAKVAFVLFAGSLLGGAPTGAVAKIGSAAKAIQEDCPSIEDRVPTGKTLWSYASNEGITGRVDTLVYCRAVSEMNPGEVEPFPYYRIRAGDSLRFPDINRDGSVGVSQAQVPKIQWQQRIDATVDEIAGALHTTYLSNPRGKPALTEAYETFQQNYKAAHSWAQRPGVNWTEETVYGKQTFRALEAEALVLEATVLRDGVGAGKIMVTGSETPFDNLKAAERRYKDALRVYGEAAKEGRSLPDYVDTLPIASRELIRERLGQLYEQMAQHSDGVNRRMYQKLAEGRK